MSEEINTQSKTQAQNTEQIDVITQEKHGFRDGWPEWLRQMPQSSIPESQDNWSLISMENFEAELDEKAKELKVKALNKAAIDQIQEDVEFLDYELVRLFRERDYNAKSEQNRYRIYQLTFMILATLATVIGSFQAIALSSSPGWLPLLAFGETAVALFTTFIATISSRETPLPMWMMNRRRAEYLRREFYRFLMDLPPYTDLSGYQRKQRLSIRAANINRGVYPDKSAD